MLENTEGTTPAEPTIEELKAQVDGLTSKLNYQSNWRQELVDKIGKAKRLVQNSIDNDEWTDSELEEPFWTELCEILDIELNKVYEVIIRAEWSATLKGPRNMSLSDMADYVTIDEPSVSRYNSIEIDDIYEREVGIDEA
jgi:hypothetical protein